MAGYGGAVKLTGESEYQRALKNITQSLKEQASEMKVLASQYDKNDKSTQAMASKSEALNQKLQIQSEKLNILKTRYNEVNAQYGKNSQAQKQLTDELTKEKAELERIGNQLGKTSKDYLEQQKVVDQLENKQQSFNKAVSDAKIQMNQAQAEVNKTTKELDNLGKEEDDVTKKTKSAGDGFTVFKGILANLGTQAINTAINGLKSLGSSMINLGKQALNNYAEYEQLVGGVETLFKDSAKIVEGYANEAYKTAGLSANQYMDTVTSFSASLLQSLGGDTKKAADYSNRAIIDMSDNANKMGTDMQMLQNAYQGFAKQNFQMLDNLKLGYGGTKTEMQRLIKDASKLTDVQKELGITVDANDMSFGNIVNAISVVQKEMGIMGTTSKEASSTIQGSVNAMKSSWQNLLTGLADDNAEFSDLMNNFIESLETALKNLLPRVKVIIQGVGMLLGSLLQYISNSILPELPAMIEELAPVLIDAISQLIPEIINTLLTMLPQLIDIGIKGILSLIQGLSDALPKLIAMLPTIIKDIANTLIDNLPLIIDTGIELIFALIDGLIEALPDLIDYIPEIIDKLVMAITDNLPKLIEAGVILIVKLAEGLIKAIPQLISKIPQIMSSLLNGIANYYSKLLEMGVNLLSKLISGIGSMLGKLGDKAKEIGTTIIDKIKNLPKEMLNWGKDMIQGLINGIKGMINKVGDAVKGVANKIKNFLHFSRPDEGPLREYEEWMPDMISGLSSSLEKSSPKLINQIRALSSEMDNALQPNLALNGLNLNETGSSNINAQSNFNSMVEAFKTALSDMDVVMDDEVFGKFIDKTVAKAIYS